MLRNLRLYQIPWSHYCDKVRWALDLLQLPYELVRYNPFGKTKGLERVPKTVRKLMPILEDPNNTDDGLFISDSTPILLYLNEKYPQSPVNLFPSSSSDERQIIIDKCLQFDSELGLYARRLAYLQILVEKPSLLSMLLGEKFQWAYNPDNLRSHLVAPVAACFMISRFRLHRIREDRVRERTEAILLEVGDHLRSNAYLVGQQFTAADLTFCSLMKPLKHVPFFCDDQRFQIVFDYHERIRRKHDPQYPNIDNLIEIAIDKHRLKQKLAENRLSTRVRAFLRRINLVQRFFYAFFSIFVRNAYGPETDAEEVLQFKTASSSTHNEKIEEAQNDQRRANITSKWSFIKFFFKYYAHLLFTIPDQARYLNNRR